MESRKIEMEKTEFRKKNNPEFGKKIKQIS